MPYNNYEIQLAAGVVCSATLQDTIVIVDSTPTIYHYSYTGAYIRHNGFSGLSSLEHRYSKALGLSLSGRYLLITDEENGHILLLDVATKKTLLQLKMEKNPKFCHISTDESFLIVANGVGRALIYSMQTLKRYDEVAFVDEIATVEFLPDASKIVVSCLNKQIYIYDMPTKKIEHKLAVPDVVEVISAAKNGNDLLLITRAGDALKYTINSQEIFIVDSCYEWATTYMQNSSGALTLVGTRSSEIYIYTTQKGKLLGSISLEHWGVTTLSEKGGNLFVGFSNGYATIVDFSEAIKDAKEAITRGDYESFCTIIQAYPLVFMNEEIYNLIAQNYKKILAHKPSTSSEKEGHSAVVALLISNEELHDLLLKELFSSQEMINFTKNLEHGRPQKSCAMVYDVPLLQQLKEYSVIRTKCHQNVEQEFRELEENPESFIRHLNDKEQSCLKCKNSPVKGSLGLAEAYLLFRKSAKAKNYVAIFDIASRYPILRQSTIFKRLMHSGESLIEKMLIMMRANRMDDALKYATKLASVKPFAKVGLSYKKQIMMYANFSQACLQRDIDNIFSIASDNPALRTTVLFKEQQRLYQKHYEKGEEIARSGEVSAMLEHMSPYMNVESKLSQNRDLIRTALLYEIKNYAPEGEESIFLQKYYDCFGWSEEYANICAFFGIQSRSRVEKESVDEQCYECVTLLEGERVKRKDHFKSVGRGK